MADRLTDSEIYNSLVVSGPAATITAAMGRAIEIAQAAGVQSTSQIHDAMMAARARVLGIWNETDCATKPLPTPEQAI
jgi:hypothetical protein